MKIVKTVKTGGLSFFSLSAFWLAAGLLPGSAYAAGITADLGTTGLGVHLVTPLRQNLNARVGVNYFSYSYDISTTNIDYEADLDLRTADFLLDYFPRGNRFRITAGLIYNGNKIDVVGRPNATGTYIINGVAYDASDAGRLDGDVDFRRAAPYLGIGWGNGAVEEKGWRFSADLGVMFHGSPSTSLAMSGCTAPAATCAALAQDLEVERRDLQEEIDEYEYFPVVRIGLSYWF